MALTAKPGALAFGILAPHIATAAGVACTAGVGDPAALSAAITAANLLTGPTTISLGAGCIYSLPSAAVGSDGLPRIVKQIVIEGNGATITRSSDTDFRIFEVGDTSGQTTLNGDLALRNLTVTHGKLSGNAIDGGGGILNNAGSTLTVTGSTISGNTATALVAAGGGGIETEGTTTISGSTITGNSVDITSNISSRSEAPPPLVAVGGGIAAKGGTLTVTNSTINNNSVSATGTATVGGPNVSAFGGGIAAKANPTSPATIGVIITGSTLTGNSASASSMSGKNATAGGGGIADSNTFQGTHTTVAMTVTNDTLFRNTASASSTGTGIGTATSSGGGIGMPGTTGDTLAVINSTIANNTSGQSGIDQSGTGAATVTNTIVANNAGGNCNGAITDGGHNISFPSGTTAQGTCATGFSALDPLLGTLLDNGGPTKTMALGTGSSAIDAADNKACQKALPGGAGGIDQRGLLRAEVNGDVLCDVGAFEVQPPPPVVPSPSPSPSAGQAAAPKVPKAGGSNDPDPVSPLVPVAGIAAAGAAVGLGRRKVRGPDS